MTINIEALIRCLGQTYHKMVDQGIIPYKKKPSGEYGDPDLNLDLVKEGVFLSSEMELSFRK